MPVAHAHRPITVVATVDEVRLIDASAIRVILEHRREAPAALFSLAGRPHLRLVDVGRTDVAAYGALLGEDQP